MRVLQLTQYLALGGLEKCVFHIAMELRARGIHSVVAVYEDLGIDDALKEKLLLSDVNVHRWQKSKGFCIKTVIKLFVIVSRERINVIHSHDLGALIYACFISMLTLFRVRVIHTQHSFVHFRKDIKRYQAYERFFPRIANQICTVSQSISDLYVSLGIPKKNMAVVPNGIAFPSSFVPREAARKKVFELVNSVPEVDKRISQSDVRILLYLGRLVRGKGLERLIKIWSQLHEDLHSQWILLLVGPFERDYFNFELRPQIENCNQRPLILAGTDNPFLFYQSADAFVSLSEQEGMPLAANEAAGTGLPMILSDIEGHRGLSEQAILLPTHGLEADVTCFRDFLTSTPIRDSLVKWHQSALFRQRNSVALMVDSYIKYYSKVLVKRAVFFLLLSIFSGSNCFADDQPQQITSVMERPEYLQLSDWQRSLELQLSKGEKALLTLKNSEYCGVLPKLSANLIDAGIKTRWFGGVEITLKQSSFEGALPGNYVEALVPLEAEVPCKSEELQRLKWIFLEIEALENSVSGRHSGNLTSRMSADGVQVPDSKQQWNVNIEIFENRFSEKWRLPLRAEFTPFFASKAHFGRSGEEEGQLTESYIRSMVEHRVLPLKAWIKHPFLNESERQSEPFFLSHFPSSSFSYPKTVLRALPNWVAVDVPRVDSREESKRREYWQSWQRYFQTAVHDPFEAWTKDRMSRDLFVYLWDEPAQEQFNQMVSFADSVVESAPAIKSLVTIYPWESLQKSIYIFAPLLQHLAREGKPILQTGRELWSYVSCMSHGCGSEYSSGEPDFVVERNAAYIRVWGWMAEHYQLSTVLYYSVNNIWRRAPHLDPWKDIFDFTGHGDGTLFYPGRPKLFNLKDHRPIPSLRLKFWRQASYDSEYIHLAREKNPSCFEKLKSKFFLVRDAFSWNRNPRVYHLARQELINCVVAELRGTNTEH